MKTCKYLPNPDYKEDWIPAKFHGLYQRLDGTIIIPVAVVEDEDGLHEVEVWRVKEIESGEEDE